MDISLSLSFPTSHRRGAEKTTSGGFIHVKRRHREDVIVYKYAKRRPE